MSEQKKLEQRIKEKIALIEASAPEYPGVIIIHNLDGNVVYMSPRGLEELGVTLAELKEMGPEYHDRFFNPEDVKDYYPKLKGLLESNDPSESISFFQQVRLSETDDWVWHISSVKVFMHDDEGRPIMSITFSFPVDPLHHLTSKVSRLLDEKNFRRRNRAQFSKLSIREREVLKLTSLGKNSPEIADELCISAATAETHRRNLRKKLKVNNNYDLSQYARAFDLI